MRVKRHYFSDVDAASEARREVVGEGVAHEKGMRRGRLEMMPLIWVTNYLHLLAILNFSWRLRDTDSVFSRCSASSSVAVRSRS